MSDFELDDGPVYAWHDGDRTLTARLQGSLVAEQQDGAGGAHSEIVPRSEESPDAESYPVFRSQSGALMTLPGGLLLLLDPEWDQARVDRFFADNSIAKGRVSERAFGEHAFFVATDPGFPSLNLANALAHSKACSSRARTGSGRRNSIEGAAGRSLCPPSSW